MYSKNCWTVFETHWGRAEYVYRLGCAERVGNDPIKGLGASGESEIHCLYISQSQKTLPCNLRWPFFVYSHAIAKAKMEQGGTVLALDLEGSKEATLEFLNSNCYYFFIVMRMRNQSLPIRQQLLISACQKTRKRRLVSLMARYDLVLA